MQINKKLFSDNYLLIIVIYSKHDKMKISVIHNSVVHFESTRLNDNSFDTKLVTIISL